MDLGDLLAQGVHFISQKLLMLLGDADEGVDEFAILGGVRFAGVILEQFLQTTFGLDCPIEFGPILQRYGDGFFAREPVPFAEQ